MMPITELIPGTLAAIVAILAGAERRERLASYGLVRGTLVRVLQHRPVLVLAVDGTELALEARVAADIRVAPR